MSICSVNRSTGLRAALTLAVLLPLTGGGCDGIRPIPGDVSRFDSAGVSVVVNHERASVGADGRLTERMPETTIGAIDGPSGQLLHGVVDVDLVADGILVVQETNVRLYDERGTLDRSFGREGRGPGEFTRISSAVSCGDDLFATDLVRAGLIGFRWGGDTWSVEFPSLLSGSLNALTLHRCVGGDVYATIHRSAPTTGDRGVVRARIQAARLDPATAGLDTLLTVPGRELFDGLHVPFGTNGVIAFGDTLFHFVDTERPEVRSYSTDGELVRIVRLRLTGESVTEGDVARIREDYLDPAPPAARREIEERLDEVPIPSAKPVFSDLLAARDGTIWLRRYRPFGGEGGGRWDVVGEDGRWLATVRVPDHFSPRVVTGERVVGITVDSLGVERVQLYRLQSESRPSERRSSEGPAGG